MNFKKREEPLPAAGGVEQITAEFPIYPGPVKDSVVDDVRGRSEDALADLKHRIRGTVLSTRRA